MLRDVVDNYKSRGGDVEPFPIECPYCRQIVAVELTPDMRNNKELQREIVIETCKCPEAQYEAGRKRRIESIDENLKRTIGIRSPKPVPQDIYDIAKELAKQVCFEDIKKATLNFTGTDKLTLSLDSKGKLNINREEKAIYSRII